MPETPLTISPSEHLKFRFELKKQSSTTLRLTNTGTSNDVAFKVKTTSPKKYCVRPNTGVVAPGATQEVQILMSVQKDYPPDIANCKDKFLVQSVVVTDSSKDVSDLFAKGNTGISEAKLKVVYEQPPPPSPIREETPSDLTEEVPNDAPKRADPRLEATKADLIAATKGKNAADEETTRLRTQVSELTSQLDSARADLVKAAVTAGGASGGATTTVEPIASSSFTLVHLVLVALLAFFLGRYV